MSNRKKGPRPVPDQHRQTLFAVLYLCGVVLMINAWLVSQQLLSF
jgi:hypothetical protein